MKKLILIFTLIAFTVCFSVLNAQELRVKLTVNSAQVPGTNKAVFETLQTALNEYLQDRKWTDFTYGENERIDCNIMLTVKSYTDEIMSCELQVTANRPVYGASYTTPLFNFRDEKVNFIYKEFDPIELNTSTYDNNIAAILAYYAYVVIGMDLDSFSKLGGTPAFHVAEQIVNQSQSKSNEVEASGWKAFDSDRNRYALINNLLDERFKKFRNFYYDYHRLGLDIMSQNVSNGRAKIAEGLPILRELKRQYPSSILLITFLDAKNDELINMFSSRATESEKKSVYEILTDVNPAATSRYEAIKTGK